MAKLPSRGRAKKLYFGNAASAVPTSAYQSYSGQYNKSPFGPQMAHEIFNLSDYYEECASSEDYDDYDIVVSSDYEHWYQTELPLENVRQLEERYRSEIKKFERAYHKLMIGALQWHYLTEEAEENPQIMKMFKDMQLMRKLGGSDRV